MDLKNLIPASGRKNLFKRTEEHPFVSLQREMNRLFDVFLRGWEEDRFPDKFGAFTPCIDVTEDDKAVRVEAELPGMSDKDIELSLSRDALTITGEKRDGKEERTGNYFHTERSFGSFMRTIPLPVEIDAEKAQARFEKGILKITLPKAAEARKEAKKIRIRTE